MSNERSMTVVPSFASVGELDFALSQKGTGSGADLYFRDGTQRLASTEAHIADLVGVEPVGQ